MVTPVPTLAELSDEEVYAELTLPTSAALVLVSPVYAAPSPPALPPPPYVPGILAT